MRSLKYLAFANEENTVSIKNWAGAVFRVGPSRLTRGFCGSFTVSSQPIKRCSMGPPVDAFVEVPRR
jgi:hypothetical protein